MTVSCERLVITILLRMYKDTKRYLAINEMSCFG